MKRKLLLSCAFISLLAGCSTTLKPTSVNALTGEFDTKFKIINGGIKVKEPFKSEYADLIYVKTSDDKSERYNKFFLSSIKNSKKFNKVTDKSAMESLVLEKQLTEQVSSVSDLIGLHNLQKHIGNFLILEPYVEHRRGYNFYSSIKAIDAKTGKPVLYLENEAFNWDGLDQPLFYPLLNGLIQWVDGKEINQEAKKKSKKKNS